MKKTLENSFVLFGKGGDPILSAENRYTSYDDNVDTTRIHRESNGKETIWFPFLPIDLKELES